MLPKIRLNGHIYVGFQLNSNKNEVLCQESSNFVSPGANSTCPLNSHVINTHPTIPIVYHVTNTFFAVRIQQTLKKHIRDRCPTCIRHGFMIKKSMLHMNQ